MKLNKMQLELKQTYQNDLYTVKIKQNETTNVINMICIPRWIIIF